MLTSVLHVRQGGSRAPFDVVGAAEHEGRSPDWKRGRSPRHSPRSTAIASSHTRTSHTLSPLQRRRVVQPHRQRAHTHPLNLSTADGQLRNGGLGRASDASTRLTREREAARPCLYHLPHLHSSNSSLRCLSLIPTSLPLLPLPSLAPGPMFGFGERSRQKWRSRQLKKQLTQAKKKARQTQPQPLRLPLPLPPLHSRDQQLPPSPAPTAASLPPSPRLPLPVRCRPLSVLRSLRRRPRCPSLRPSRGAHP